MKTESYSSKPEGKIPNSRFPLLIHRGAIPGGGVDAVKARFRKNGWGNNWQYPGIYEYAHFHSTSHECLGCAAGWMEFNLSVDGWTKVRLETGDVIVMPAGVSHEMIGHSEDIMVCGGYAGGRDWDNIQEAYLTPDLYYQACKQIMALPIPDRDPVTGDSLHQWHDAPSSVDGGWNDFRDGLDASG